MRFAVELHAAAVRASHAEGRRALVDALRPHPVLTGLMAMISSDVGGMQGAARRCTPAERQQLSRVALQSVARDDDRPAACLDLNLALWLHSLHDVELEGRVRASRDGAFSVPSKRLVTSAEAAQAPLESPEPPPPAAQLAPGQPQPHLAHLTQPQAQPPHHQSQAQRAQSARAGACPLDDVAGAVAAERAAAVPQTARAISGGGASPFSLMNLYAHSDSAPRRIRTTKDSFDPRSHKPRARVAPRFNPNVKPAQPPAPTRPARAPKAFAPAPAFRDAAFAGSVYVGDEPASRHPLHDFW